MYCLLRRCCLLVVVAFSLALVVSPVFATECVRSTWTKVQATGDRPINVGGHVLVDFLGHLFTFGGLFDSFSNFTNVFHRTLWSFNSLTNAWTVEDPGTGPTARAFYGASAVYLTGSMYVYGGVTYNGDFSNVTIYSDFWRWDFFGHQWHAVSHTGSLTPGPRGDFGLTTLDGHLYMFGGIVDDFFTDTNELWRFNPITRVWTLLKPFSTDGSSPSARHQVQFRASQFQHKIYLYGGEITAEGFAIAGDTWVYDPITNTWTDITPSDPYNIQPARNFAASAMIGRKFALHGGDVGGGPQSCNSPFPQNPTNETWQFDIINRVWTQRFPAFSPRLKRHAGASIGSCFYVHGGWDFQECQVWNNDLWTLRIDALTARSEPEEGERERGAESQEEEETVDPNSGPRLLPKVRPWGGPGERHPLLDIIAQRRAELGL